MWVQKYWWAEGPQMLQANMTTCDSNPSTKHLPRQRHHPSESLSEAQPGPTVFGIPWTTSRRKKSRSIFRPEIALREPCPTPSLLSAALCQAQSKCLWRKLARRPLDLLPNILFTEKCLTASHIFGFPRGKHGGKGARGTVRSIAVFPSEKTGEILCLLKAFLTWKSWGESSTS